MPEPPVGKKVPCTGVIRGLPQETLDRIVSSVLSAVAAERVFVFGSYARGEQTPESDIDIFVVADDASAHTLGDIRMALAWLPMHVDVLSERPEDFARTAERFGNVEYEVLGEGVEIYDGRP